MLLCFSAPIGAFYFMSSEDAISESNGKVIQPLTWPDNLICCLVCASSCLSGVIQ